MRFSIYRRKPDTGPGHPRIFVYEHQDTEGNWKWSPALPRRRGRDDVQVATIDRIPFVISRANLAAHYEPEVRGGGDPNG